MKTYTEAEFDPKTYFYSHEGSYDESLMPGITLKTNDIKLIENIAEFYKGKLAYSAVNERYDECILAAETIKSIKKCLDQFETEDAEVQENA